jgi:hypothetical protein
MNNGVSTDTEKYKDVVVNMNLLEADGTIKLWEKFLEVFE